MPLPVAEHQSATAAPAPGCDTTAAGTKAAAGTTATDQSSCENHGELADAGEKWIVIVEHLRVCHEPAR